MDDFLEYTAVRRGRSALAPLYWLSWAAVVAFGACALLALSGAIGTDPGTGRLAFSLRSLLLGVAAGAVAFAAYRGKDSLRLEYDYSFTNGALDISSVMNNRRRRYLCAMDIGDVVRCGPATGPGFERALGEPNVRRHNWYVNRDAKLYFFCFQKEGQRHLAVLELPDAMIAVIRSRKYLGAGVWCGAEGERDDAGLS